MMETKKQKAVGLPPETAFQTALRKPNPNAESITAQAECGKRSAIAAYCWGVLSLDGCARLFQRHLVWREA